MSDVRIYPFVMWGFFFGKTGHFHAPRQKKIEAGTNSLDKTTGPVKLE